MNHIEEIIAAIGIALVVATFLLNTGRALKAIELCKESLIMLNNKAPSIKQQFGKLINLVYKEIYKAIFKAYRLIHDNASAITYGKKLLAIYCECGDIVSEGYLSIDLAQRYHSQGKFVEAKELTERAITIMRETGDKRAEAIAYGILGTVFISLGDYVKAKECLEKSLAISMEIGDRAGIAYNYQNLGTVLEFLGDYVKAKEYLEKSLAIYIEIGDRAGEATSYGRLGTVFISLGDYVKAKEYLEKSLAIYIEIGDRAGIAASYGCLGTVFKSLGDYVKAKEYVEKALAISMEIGDRAGIAASYGYLGTVFRSLGDNVKAKEYVEKSLAISMEINDRVRTAANYANLGNVFNSFGDYVKAKEYHEKALAIQMEIGDKEGLAGSYGNLGNVFFSLGDYVKAKECQEKALAIAMKIGNKAGVARCFANLGTAYLGLRKYRESKEHLKKALAITINIDDRAEEAALNRHLGDVDFSLGDSFKAKMFYKKALAVAIEIGARREEAEGCLSLAMACHSLTEYVTAEEYLDKALSVSKDIKNGETEFQCYCFLALTKLTQGTFEETKCYLLQSIKKCEELRGFNRDNDEILISFADMHDFPYKMLSALFCEARTPNYALYVAELGRARALADLMATQYSAETRISADPQSWIAIENFMTKQTNCTCLYISYFERTVFLWILKTSGVISLRKTTVDKNTLCKRLAQPAKNLDEFFAIMAKRFRSFGILPEEVCEDRSLNDIEPAETDFSQEESDVALRQGEDEKNPEPSLTLFHEMLINPVSDLLDEPEIIIVPDRNLYRVPFAAVLDKNGKYLSETFKVRIVPSLTTLKHIQDTPADYHSRTGALIVGDPDVGHVIFHGRLYRNFYPLSGAREEAEMIGRLLGVQPLLGQHATKQAVLQRIASVSLIHFAAHGDAERGEIALAPPRSTAEIPQEDDYLLKMSDISKVQLRAKLVVLSCCHSGRGQIRAEGAVGIARAFLGCGARSVLAALWALEDIATKQFMNCFYEHLVRGESASESLHEAMKWMRDNGFTSVSEWAPFMLIGDNVTFDFRK